MSSFPQTLYVSGSSVEPYTAESWEEISRDPRGLLFMWEPPDPKAKYVMGLDPTQGITGWTRATRTNGDDKTDNGVIEIIRVDGEREPIYKAESGVRIPDIDPITKRQKWLHRDVQVAEFAAPCDAVEIAQIANVLGRIYSGSDEDQCELVWESWPGCGMLTTQELLRLGYGNLWMWEYIDSAAEATNRMGWRSTHESQKILWYRSRRHLMNRQTVIRSKFLLDELSNAEIDLTKMRARAAYGYHDDRMQAYNMATWAAHKWTYEIDRTDVPVQSAPVIDYQNYAPGLDDYESYSDWKIRATEDWD